MILDQDIFIDSKNPFVDVNGLGIKSAIRRADTRMPSREDAGITAIDNSNITSPHIVIFIEIDTYSVRMNAGVDLAHTVMNCLTGKEKARLECIMTEVGPHQNGVCEV